MGGNAQAAMDAGGAVLEVLASGSPPKAQVDAWIDAYGLPFTTGISIDGQADALYGPREWGYVIDLCDMKIVWAEFGNFGSPTPQNPVTGETGLAALMNCLQNGC